MKADLENSTQRCSIYIIFILHLLLFLFNSTRYRQTGVPPAQTIGCPSGVSRVVSGSGFFVPSFSSTPSSVKVPTLDI